MMRLSVLVLLTVVMGGVLPLPGQDPPAAQKPADPIAWPQGLPVYDHVVIVVEENKDYEQIVDDPGNPAVSKAPYINLVLRKDGASFTKMFGEEHHSQGNYFWLFSGSNQGVGFRDGVPEVQIRHARNLGAALIEKHLTFKGFSEDLPGIGSVALAAPPQGEPMGPAYARKHVPWISFDNVPNKGTAKTSSNLPFTCFPADAAGFASLPTVGFVIPNLTNDMHDYNQTIDREIAIKQTVLKGDKWLKDNLGSYYEWAKTHNSLLIVTWDESDDRTGAIGLTDPFATATGQSKKDLQLQKDRQNRICTIFAGDHVKPGAYIEGAGVTHVNILRTLEAMYRLPRAGAQQPNAATGGITDDFIITDVFEKSN